MKFWITQLFVVATVIATTGQDIDQAMMDKDLEVAENILATLMKQTNSNEFYFLNRGQNVEGKYLPNFGVVFNVSGNQFQMLYLNKMDQGEETSVEVAEMDDEDQPSSGLVEAFKDFLADYGGMIRQLKPADKILVRTENSRGNRGMAVIGNEKKIKINKGMSAELSKEYLEAYDAGKISREELLRKIEIKESADEAKREPELEVFSSTLERLYEIDLTDTYYMTNAPDYERMEKFGVTYYLKFYSSTVHDDNDYSLPTVSKKHISKAQRDQIVEDMYPLFLEELKQNLLDYGVILKNLDPKEMVVLHIKLTSCEDCDMPAIIDVSTTKSVIEDYRNGSLSKEKAMSMIEVKDVGD
ncbi:MAG: hypothetical protein KDC53_20750 [Saprospiraceae bacterium]|nr:hypothetical protein [Saprospiraceae bacterium]